MHEQVLTDMRGGKVAFFTLLALARENRLTQTSCNINHDIDLLVHRVCVCTRSLELHLYFNCIGEYFVVEYFDVIIQQAQ